MSWWGSSGLDKAKLRVQLGLSMIRTANLIKKETELVKRQKRDIAGLLKDGKESKAKIRVESIIRKDYRIEALELIEMWCGECHIEGERRRKGKS